ncbi:MAG: hypothetical protein K0U98_15010 [Deltaproteobacteria bacterium]|nr:hypothetical protein [Deltaproteobacteria bacterium]
MIRVIALTLALALAAGTVEADGEIKAKVAEKARAEIAKKIPSRGSPAVWCTALRCDAGVSGSFLRKESRLFRDRYWTMDAFLGKESAGVGFTVEPIKRSLAGELRIFVGAAFVVELDAHDLGTLPGRGALLFRATF